MGDWIDHRTIAWALIAGCGVAEEMERQVWDVLDKKHKWVRSLVRRYISVFGTGQPKESEVIELVASKTRARKFHVARVLVTPPDFHDPYGWGLPSLATEGDLAASLELNTGDLEWFADRNALSAKRCSPQLRHYRYRLVAKRLGGFRLIEAPKLRLKRVQRWILESILNRVPASGAAHGFVRGRSVRSFASQHTGQRVVLKLDLRNFFPSVTKARVNGLFRGFGYRDSVASILAGLCTTTAPREIWTQAGVIYSMAHLPQGAPSSPAVANLCAYRMDARLSGLAMAAGARYSRYADDLAFSGSAEFERSVERFAIHAASIVLSEGFEVEHRKTRILRRGVRQRLAGVVVNDAVGVARQERDQLKAILTNCQRQGPASQNREGHPDFRAHLAGRVGWVEMIHPAQGRKLRDILERIDWTGRPGAQSAS